MTNMDEIRSALSALTGPRKIEFTLPVVILRVGNRYVGTSQLAGQVFRGNPAADQLEAARSLLMQLVQGNNADATMALDLAVAGESIESLGTAAMAALANDGGASRAAVEGGDGQYAEDAECEVCHLTADYLVHTDPNAKGAHPYTRARGKSRKFRR